MVGRKKGEPKPEEVTMELVDGALNLTQEGDETMVLKLTDAGELVMEIGFVSLYFVPAPVEAESFFPERKSTPDGSPPLRLLAQTHHSIKI